MSTETELKFRIPTARLDALRRAVATPKAQQLALAAVYLDTPGCHLAAARMALRLRREGGQWVQTLKAEGRGPLERLEHNAPVPAPAGQADATPALDPGRNAGSAAGQALAGVLAAAGAGQPLGPRYATTVARTRRLLRSAGAVVELALDEGRLQADGWIQPISELELELLSGTPQALLTLAGRWAARFGLLLDVRSKSERGHTLAAGLPGSPAAAAPGLLEAPLTSWLRPLLANASQLADGPATLAHLQQLLACLAAARQALAAGGAGASPTDGAVDGAAAGALGAASVGQATAAWARPLHGEADGLERALAALAEALASALDEALHGLAAGLAPVPAAGAPARRMLAEAGAGLQAWADPPSAAACRLLRAPATQQLWLRLLGLAAAPGR